MQTFLKMLLWLDSAAGINRWPLSSGAIALLWIQLLFPHDATIGAHFQTRPGAMGPSLGSAAYFWQTRLRVGARVQPGVTRD
jgi:hypothetical protein